MPETKLHLKILSVVHSFPLGFLFSLISSPFCAINTITGDVLRTMAIIYKKPRFTLHEVDSGSLYPYLPSRYWFVEYDGVQSGNMILNHDFALQLVQWLNHTNVDIALEDRQFLLKTKQPK